MSLSPVVSRQPPLPDEFNSLREAVGWPAVDEPFQLKGIFTHSRFWVSVRDGQKLVGMGRLLGDDYSFCINDIVVHPEWQGQGIGRLVMEEVMVILKELKMPKAYIGLFAADGKSGFYEKFGFRSRPTEGFGPGMFIMYPELNGDQEGQSLFTP